jgi:replicative DNA helicase
MPKGERNFAPRIDTLRKPPHSNDAEQSVLGALMLDQAARVKIADWITEEDFYRKDHRIIFRAITDLAIAGKPCDPVTMGEWFEANGMAELVGGSNYVLQISNSTPSSANLVAYAEIVKETSRQRQLIDIGTEITGAGFERQESSLTASQAVSKLSSLVGDVRAGGLAKMKTAVHEFFAELHNRYELSAALTGLQTPWAGLDDLLFGWQPELIMLAGRPNNGKTATGLQAAGLNAVVNNKATAIFSLEMTRTQMVGRMVAQLGRIQHRLIRNPQAMPEDLWPHVTGAITRIANAPLFIDDTPRLTADQIIARATRCHLQNPLEMIVIDHFHEMKFFRRGSERVEEMGDEARKLKKLAKDLKIPVILLLQLKRKDDEFRRPTMEDLRGSGALEEVGDTILFVHKTQRKDVVELIVGKAREAESGGVFKLENRFDEMRLDEFEFGVPPADDDDKPRPAKSGIGGRKKGVKSHPALPED